MFWTKAQMIVVVSVVVLTVTGATAKTAQDIFAGETKESNMSTMKKPKNKSSFGQGETPSLRTDDQNTIWQMKENDFARVALKTDERINQIRKGKTELIFVDESGDYLPENTIIKVRQIGHEFLFGSYVRQGDVLTDPKYHELQKYFLNIFNYATVHVHWYSGSYSYSNGVFDTHGPDIMIKSCLDYCDNHHITVKGHPLAWNRKDPTWLEGSSAEIFNILKQYGINRVKTYKNRIKIWDAVNEAAEYNEGTRPTDAPLTTKMIEEIGVPSYVEQICRNAKGVDPSNTIIVNEATQIFSRIPKIEALLKSLEEKSKTPVYDVIGLQFHHGKRMLPLNRVWEIIDRIGKFTDEIHITEISLACETPEEEAMQAVNIKLFYKLMFSHPKIKALTYWYLWDGVGGFQKGGGLLRKDFSPKPTYDVLKQLITREWMTTINFNTGKVSSYPINGFWGEYEVIAKLNNKTLKGKFSLSRNTGNSINIQLKTQ
jgi:endo-1,4-beta-xylanase